MPAAALELSNADWLAVEREYCQRSLANFVRRAWSVFDPTSPLVYGWHIDAICDHLEAITRQDLNRLLINIPPGCMKSSLTNVLWPAWEWGPKSKGFHRIISGAHELGLSTRDTRAMRRVIQSDWYQSLWPTTISSDQNQKTYYENSETGFRQACAVSSMTGKRGHRVLWDDPLSAEDANSEKNRETVIREFRETMPSRLVDPTNSAIVIVMQRLHERDPAGFILSEGLEYEHLCLPMEFEPSRRCVTSVGFRDPRTEDGELLFPGRFPREVVERDKSVMTEYSVAGQFQQRPAPRGGGVFKDEWWSHWTVLPRVVYRMVYADTAQKTAEQNDYSVFQCWGMGVDGRIYLLDQVRGKWEAPQLLTQAKAFWSKHKPVGKGLGTLRKFKVEDKSSGTGLIQQLSQAQVPVEGIPRDRDKVVRAYDAAPQIEAGNVVIPDSAPWLSEYMAEFSGFPNKEHDDQVDPTMDAIDDMLTNSTVKDWESML